MRLDQPCFSLVALSLGLLWLRVADAATITAASCSQSDVQSAITSAKSGDIVNLPGPCSPTWSSGAGVGGALLIPNSKGITLNGGGNVTLAASPSIDVELNATASSRVTGFTFTGGGTDNYGDLVVCASGSCSSDLAPFRVDNNTFTSPTGAVFVAVWGLPTGLIDHNTLTAGPAAEMIHNMGLGNANQVGWTNAVTPGSPYMVYIESNTFINSSPNSTNLKCIESYYGAETVVRYNTLQYNVAVDQHGTAGQVGARWWEFYGNTFVAGGYRMTAFAALRGGSGVFFNNHLSGSYSDGSPGVSLYEEDSGYPACFQVGRGYDPVGNCTDTGNTPNAGNSEWLSPAYLWGNDSAIQSTIASGSSNVVSGRDYYASITQPSPMMKCQSSLDSGTTTSCSTAYDYAPFTYPYPLDANGMPNPAGEAVLPPTSLSATAH